MRLKLLPLLLLIASASYASDDNSIVSIETNRQNNIDVVRIEAKNPFTFKPQVTLTTSLRPKLIVKFDDVENTVKYVNVNDMRVINKITPEFYQLIIDIDEFSDFTVRVNENVLLIGINIPPVKPEETVKHEGSGFKIISSLSSASLLKVASALYANGVYDDVIENLNELLMLPEDDNTRKGQELLCSTYEKLGKHDRAKAEYQAYIAKYPNSDNVKTMRQRLIALEIMIPGITLQGVKRKPKEGKEHVTTASISDYYFIGSTTEQMSKWHTDQKINIVNFRVTEMYRDEEYTTKILFRHSRLYDLLHDNKDSHQTSVASIEFTDAMAGYSVKAGRQFPTAGVIGRFDGLSTKYAIKDGLKAIAVTGEPYVGITSTKRFFYGAGLEYTFENNSVLSGYFNRQTADGIDERHAYGIDYRYATNGFTWFSTLEYDTLYKKINAITAQSNFNVMEGLDLYFVLDRRKFPVLLGDKALMLGFNRPDGRAYSSFKDVVNNSGMSLTNIYNFIDKTTPTSNAFVLGVNKSISDKWSVYADTQMTNVTSSSDPTFIPTLENQTSRLTNSNSGNIFYNNINFFGNNVLSKNDMHNIMLGRSSDKTSTGYSATIVNSKTFDNNVRIDIANKYMTRAHDGIETNAFSTSIRGNFKLTESSSAEIQLAISKTKSTHQPASVSKTFFIGFRHDLN